MVKRENGFEEADPTLFDLLEVQLSLKPSFTKGPKEVVSELLPYCGPRFEHYPRVDHFIMRVIWEERKGDLWKCVSHGASFDRFGHSVIHLACQNLSLELVSLLVGKMGGDIALNVVGKDGQTPLLAACYSYLAHAEEEWAQKAGFGLVELLLRSGAAANATDNERITPLHLAAAAGDSVMVALLLLYGADPSQKDGQGRLAIYYALESKSQKCAALLHGKNSWHEYRDRATGRLFYVNAETSEHTMERPLNVLKGPGMLRVAEMVQEQQQAEMEEEQREPEPVAQRLSDASEASARSTSSSAASKGSVFSSLTRTSSRIREEVNKAAIRARVAMWREHAWREGIRKANEKRRRQSLQALRQYQMRVVQEQRNLGKTEIEQLRKELDTIARSQQMSDSQLSELKENLRKEQDEKAEMRQTLIRVEADLRKKAQENERLRENFLNEQRLRRQHHNKYVELLGAIRVFCRIRPPLDFELQHARAAGEAHQDLQSINAVVAGEGVNLDAALVPSKGKEFRLDAIFGPGADQEQVFKEVEPLVQSAVDGYNVCIFAYGQTGSGKSFTMLGDRGNAELSGIAPRSVRTLFDLLQERYKAFAVSCYCLELYNGKLIDLFRDVNQDADLPLAVKKNPTNGMVEVENVKHCAAQSAEELLDMLSQVQDRRQVSATKMNQESSRSHLVFNIVMECTNKADDTIIKGKLSLVDLAGSEKVDQSGVTGQGLKEAVAINQSLTALGNVIAALTEKQKFIPYRDNLLTQLMQDSIGGNAKTLMIVNVSPMLSNVNESINSLQYATRVKKIKNSAKQNVENAQVSALKKQIKELEAQVKKQAVAS